MLSSINKFRVSQWSIAYIDGCYQVFADGKPVQKSLPIVNISTPWTVKKTIDGFSAVDCNGIEIEDTMRDRFPDYQVVELMDFGGTSLIYKAVRRSDGRICILKELYPYSLASSGLVFRDGVDIYPDDSLTPDEFKKVASVFGMAFKLEEEMNAQIGLYMGGETGATNDPRFLSASPIPFHNRDNSLNRYLLIDTQAGEFLDRVVFPFQGRERVIDELSAIYQLLTAVKALHEEKHCVHLDLKPENILVSLSHVDDPEHVGNHVVIPLDFGSAMHVDSTGHIIETDNVLLTSTAEYAAPEVVNASYSKIGTASDIFSVYIILQRLLLSDADIVDFNYLSPKSICASRSIQSLSEPEQRMMVEFLSSGIEQRRIRTADDMQKELGTIIEVLKDTGIHPVIIRKKAIEIAKGDFGYIDSNLLCEVEIKEDC